MTMLIDEGGGYGPQFVCAGCGEQYLHHMRVEVFSRPEDAKTGVHLTFDHGDDEARIDSDLTGNPSSRRTGIKIYFECETCPTISVLKISQHKGFECAEWEAID